MRTIIVSSLLFTAIGPGIGSILFSINILGRVEEDLVLVGYIFGLLPAFFTGVSCGALFNDRSLKNLKYRVSIILISSSFIGILFTALLLLTILGDASGANLHLLAAGFISSMICTLLFYLVWCKYLAERGD